MNIVVVTKVKKIAEIHNTIRLDHRIPGQTVPNEMDFNFNTSCAGKSYVVLELNWRTVNVNLYGSTTYNTLYSVTIVSTATAYDDPTTGENFILVLNDCL